MMLRIFRFALIFWAACSLFGCKDYCRSGIVENKYKPRLLKLATYSDPILRTKTKPVIFPLNEEDKNIIADMQYSIQPAQLKAANAPWEAAVGMAANQWGIDKSIFLYCPTGDTVNGLEVIINPSYTMLNDTDSNSQDTEWEGCFSVPLATGNIKRSLKIKVKYQDEQGTTVEKELHGWPARVWQHENDHLNGFLYDDHFAGKCLEKKTFNSIAEVDEFYDEIRNSRKN